MAIQGRCEKCESKFKAVRGLDELCKECEKIESSADLTTDQIVQRLDIMAAKHEVLEAKEQRDSLIAKCTHAPIKDGYLTCCAICDQMLSEWYCPKSPDKCCYYATEDYKGTHVRLASGVLFELEKPIVDNGQYRGAGNDFCVLCLHPTDRR